MKRIDCCFPNGNGLRYEFCGTTQLGVFTRSCTRAHLYIYTLANADKMFNLHALKTTTPSRSFSISSSSSSSLRQCVDEKRRQVFPSSFGRRRVGGVGFVRRSSSSGGGRDAATASAGEKKVLCPICRGTGLKPCGQCEGTGVNQEDKYGGKDGYRKGQPCWLCEGKRKTMCGNCIDLTDSF